MLGNDRFVLEPLARDGERGFRITYRGGPAAAAVKVEWEYEAAGTSHPRNPPYRDRVVVDFATGQTVERWFSHSTGDGNFYVLVDAGTGAPDAVFNLAANPDGETPTPFRWVP